MYIFSVQSVCVCVCVCVWVYVCVCVCVCVCVYIKTHTFTYKKLHLYTCFYIETSIFVSIYGLCFYLQSLCGCVLNYILYGMDCVFVELYPVPQLLEGFGFIIRWFGYLALYSKPLEVCLKVFSDLVEGNPMDCSTIFSRFDT